MLTWVLEYLFGELEKIHIEHEVVFGFELEEFWLATEFIYGKKLNAMVAHFLNAVLVTLVDESPGRWTIGDDNNLFFLCFEFGEKPFAFDGHFGQGEHRLDGLADHFGVYRLNFAKTCDMAPARVNISSTNSLNAPSPPDFLVTQ